MGDKREMEEFNNFIKTWALKKMHRQEKRLERFARIYFGEPVAIIYAKNGAKVVSKDGTEGEVRV